MRRLLKAVLLSLGLILLVTQGAAALTVENACFTLAIDNIDQENYTVPVHCLGVVSNFFTTDPLIFFVLELSGVPEGNLTFQTFSPDGQMQFEGETEIVLPEPRIYDYSSIFVDGSMPTGVWTVKVLFNNVSLGEAEFSLTEPTQALCEDEGNVCCPNSQFC